MHGLVLASADGQALRPALLWADSRATGALRAYRRLGPAALARLANPLAPGMTGPLLMWVAEHEPGTYRDARWALAPKDWLRARLTGEIHAEPSDASASLLYDVPGDRWDLEVVSGLGLDTSLLAPLLPSAGAPAGHLTAWAADELGLPAGIPVAAGAGDTAAAALGSGIGLGEVQLTVGTGAQVIRPLAAAGQPGGRRGQPVPVGDAGRLVPDGRHSQRRAQPQLGARGHERQLGGAVRQRRSPGPDRRPDLRPAPVGRTDTVLRSGAARLLDRAVAGRRPGVAPAVRARGNRVRDPRRPGRPAGRAPIREQGPPRLRLAGGGTLAAGWRQLLADVLGLPLYAVDVPAASGRGAALLGAHAAGLLSFDDIAGPLAPPAAWWPNRTRP